jgi:hypothetical protein
MHKGADELLVLTNVLLLLHAAHLPPLQISEIMRKGAEDTQMLLQQAGDAANQAFLAAAEMHKKYAPKPAEKPVEVSPDVRDK